jgi:anti-sigma factor RsiW
LTDHLSSTILNALADGELSAEQLALVNQHLADCPACTSNALTQSLLKSATARAGQRFVAPADLQQRMKQLTAQHAERPQSLSSERLRQPARRFGTLTWAAAVALLLIAASLVLVDRNTRRTSAESAALVTEVCDQHIATLAANSPPEVISSDRHTVKPWFQGKIPFSFNLPDNLPADTTLDGANLTYLHNQPTAQLLYRIGKHRVSIFVQQSTASPGPGNPPTDHSGFHVTAFRTGDLDVVAVSDVDPARLSDLVTRLQLAQALSR